MSIGGDYMLLIDFGNTHATFSDGRVVVIDQFKIPNEKFYYINVNPKIADDLKRVSYAIDLEYYIDFQTPYSGLGVDRRVLCSYIHDGVIVDAGSALTIDIMSDGAHKGGYIFLGLDSYYKGYTNISSVLDVKRSLKDKKDINAVPLNTVTAIESAIFKSIVLTIQDISKDKKIYFCGGDGEELSSYFKGSFFKEGLIFDAMKKIIKERILC
jgi:type III pantothenate kinase